MSYPPADWGWLRNKLQSLPGFKRPRPNNGPELSAQNSDPAATTPTSTAVVLTPAMSSASVASFFSSLATTAPQQPGNGPAPGDAASAGGDSSVDSDAGASGSDSGGISLSRGGLIAMIVVIVFVVLLGIVSSVLYYLAKKRSWEIRESIRRSARRVATALTPRRSTFPKDVRRSRGLERIEEVPPTPKRRMQDIEKGNPKIAQFEMSEPKKESKWARKFSR
ncbi:hypothetical protein B7463_g1230, partial [Scytalidium lignicola]